MRLGIVVFADALALLACPSAFAALSCWRVALAERADGLAVDDAVAKLFCQVCFAAVCARAEVFDDRVSGGDFLFHVFAFCDVTCETAPGLRPDRCVCTIPAGRAMYLFARTDKPV